MNKAITWKLTHDSTSRNLTHLFSAAIQGKNIALIGNINGMFKTCGDSNTFFETLIKLVAKLGNRIHMYIDSETNDEMRKDRMTNRLMNKPNVIIHIVRDWTKFKIGEEMKFDVAIMNPPYDRNLHLKVLEKVIPIANKVVNISPVRWLQDPFAKYLKTSDYKKFEESISKKIETLDIIPAEEATKKFDNAAFTMNLGIYVCGNGGYQYDNETPLVKKIVSKITNSNWSTHAYTKKIKTQLKPYILNVSGIHSKSANHALVCNTYSAQLKTIAPNLKSHNANNHGLFDFDSEIERVNFYNCYTHRFIEYLCTWWRVDVNINSVKVPYFGDYTKQWTTKMFCDYFDITGYIDDEHAVPGSEWEEIMKQW